MSDTALHGRDDPLPDGFNSSGIEPCLLVLVLIAAFADAAIGIFSS